jgi:hypothetical protein
MKMRIGRRSLMQKGVREEERSQKRMGWEVGRFQTQLQRIPKRR